MKHAVIENKRIWQAGVLLLALAAAVVSGCRAKAPSDQKIAADVQAKIKGESALAGQNVQVSAQSGVVTLNGTVSDDASRALAANDSGSVGGVKTVINNLTVQPAQQAMTPDVAAQQYGAPAPAPEPRRDPREKKSRHERAQDSQPTPAPQPAQVAQTPQPVAPPAVQPPPPPKPATKTITLPAGTILPVRMTETVTSATAQPDQAFHGALASDIGIRGVIAMPRGTPVQGRIVDVKEAAHFKGNALLSLQVTDVRPRGQRISVQTDPFDKKGAGRGKNTAEKSGGGALLGALIGGLAGGGKGALIGAAAGGGAGAGVNAVTRGQQAVVKTEEVVNFQLSAPITLTVPLNAAPDQGSGAVPAPQLEPRQP